MFSSFNLIIFPGIVQSIEFFEISSKEFFIRKFSQIRFTCIYPGCIPIRSLFISPILCSKQDDLKIDDVSLVKNTESIQKAVAVPLCRNIHLFFFQFSFYHANT